MSEEQNRWEVLFHDEFVPEYRDLPNKVQEEMAAMLLNLRERGPLLGRPWVDTLKGSTHSNMKELRFEAGGGVWRVAFAFDSKRRAILLVARNKAGITKDRFYRSLVRAADARFEQHMKALSRK